MHFVTVTSQGQISIPAKLRKVLGFDKTNKAVLEVKDNKVILSPVTEFSDLAGSLSAYGKKNQGKEMEEVIKTENEAVAEAAVERYRKSP